MKHDIEQVTRSGFHVGKHAANPDIMTSVWFRTGLARKKCAPQPRWSGTMRVLVAVIAAALIVVPQYAFAASKVHVDQDYDTESAGQGWSWDGKDNMALDGYGGGPISAEGDLAVTVTNENTVTKSDGDSGSDAAIEVTGGSLTIKGEGSLEVSSNKDGITASGDVSVSDGANVTVEADDKGIAAGGDVNVDASSVEVSTEEGAAISADGSVKISDSNVTASSRSGESIKYGEAMDVAGSTVAALGGGHGIHGDGDLTVTDSNLKATSTNGRAISPNGNIVFDGSTVEAESRSGDKAIAAFNGTITIENSSIVDPEQGQVVDFMDGDTVLGQTISVSGDVASKVLIEKNKEPAAVVDDDAVVDDEDDPEEEEDLDTDDSEASGAVVHKTKAESATYDGGRTLPATGDSNLGTLALATLIASLMAVILIRVRLRNLE
ncbi:MAG: carbohydrate-binding domain-containing protein [Eggerthellaceae bacterium]|nr:carbohydrate-binding domain-containing protein [Eggerthellaceae bacterium]